MLKLFKVRYTEASLIWAHLKPFEGALKQTIQTMFLAPKQYQPRCYDKRTTAAYKIWYTSGYLLHTVIIFKYWYSNFAGPTYHNPKCTCKIYHFHLGSARRTQTYQKSSEGYWGHSEDFTRCFEHFLVTVLRCVLPKNSSIVKLKINTFPMKIWEEDRRSMQPFK